MVTETFEQHGAAGDHKPNEEDAMTTYETTKQGTGWPKPKETER